MRFIRPISVALAVACTLAMVAAAAALAHVPFTVGNYSVALGWANEPTYVGELNAVEAIVTDQNGDPVNDLQPGDLQVVVSAGGQTFHPLALEPAFDPNEGTGLPGDYRAELIPTQPGDYTLHLTGNIHGAAVDETATSGPDTFDSPEEPTSIEFPNQVPSVSELATRIQSVDSRSSSDAQTALYVGAGLGLVGIVVGLIALFVAFRVRRRPTV